MEHQSDPPPPQPAPASEQSMNRPQQTGMFDGRLNRMGYLMALVYFFLVLMVPIVLQLIVRQANGAKTIANIINVLVGLVAIILIPPAVSVGVRRWHDLGQSGWFILIGFIPFIGFITFVIQLFVPGTKGPNKYGNPDTKSLNFRRVLFNN